MYFFFIQLMEPVMGSSAMLTPLVLNRRQKNLVCVCAKMAGKATDKFAMVRKMNYYLLIN